VEGPTQGEGFLYPTAGALVAFDGDHVRVVDVDNGRLSSFSGALAADVEVAVRQGRLPARLLALGSLHPALEGMAGFVGGPRLPLTAVDALRLDGWDTLFLELGGRCNERCLHCYADSSPTVEAALERSLCEAVIDDAAALGFWRVQLTGGDPLLCPFLPDLVERLAGLRVPEVEIYTNGLALDDALLDRLAPLRPALAFSFYSLESEVHDAITRTPGSQRRTLGAIERALRRGLPVRAAVVAMAENQATTAATLRFLETLGVESAGVSPSFAVGRGQRHEVSLESLPPAGHAGSDASPRSEGKLCVTYEGRVVPCVFNRSEVLGDVRRRRLSEIVRSPDLPARALRLPLALREDELQCASCRLTSAAMAEVARAVE
jgi:MoaA/NifB/PqqE/SkfB family radical SAM enzyme